MAGADGMTVALLSRRVRGVFELPAADFVPPDALGTEVRKYCRSQVSRDGRLLAVLDLPTLLRAARPRGPAGEPAAGGPARNPSAELPERALQAG